MPRQARHAVSDVVPAGVSDGVGISHFQRAPELGELCTERFERFRPNVLDNLIPDPRSLYIESVVDLPQWLVADQTIDESMAVALDHPECPKVRLLLELAGSG